MQYEYDPNKSQANKVKRGIDFEEAQSLWRDKDAVIQDARSDAEPRFVVIGRIDGLFWSAFITRRGESIRIISVRRARKEEIADYEKELARRRA
ncbi:MAG: BrnT family toxin [Deltaproteobacteria bacterium]|jgi:uncharacterized DUF497 family protein|nr:BrnT family toxin [Deltaproteobacteria bacterium]